MSLQVMQKNYFNEQRSTLNLHNSTDCRNMVNKARHEEVTSKAVAWRKNQGQTV